MLRPLQVLIVEDNPNDAELVLHALRDGGFEPVATRVDTESAYVERLHSGLDLVLSDFAMPQFSGLRALELLKQSGLEVPFIIVSGTIGEETAVAAMKQGAADYLLKDRLARLGPAVAQVLEEYRQRRERRKAGESLRIAESHLGQLLEQSPAVLFTLKLDGDKIIPHFVSENVTTLLGFPVAEVLSPGWWLGRLHPDDRERAVKSRIEALKTGASRTEYRLCHQDGHYCWVDESRRLIRDAAGAPAEISGVWTDITERKRADEVVLQASGHVARDRRKQVQIELAAIIVATVLVYLLAARFNWFEAVTRWVLTNDIQQLDETMLATIFLVVGLVVFAFRRWRESETELTSRQQAHVALGLLHEELDRRVRQRTAELGNANEALRESEERYRLLFDHNPLPMWLYDLASLRFLAVNESAVQHYGYTRAEFLGMTLGQIHPSEDVAAMVKSLKSGRTEGKKFSEWRHRKKDGTIVHVEVFAEPLLLDGRIVRLVLAADITGKKLLEAQFFRAQRLESIGTLASGIAHDLNNILAPIMMTAPLIRMSRSPQDTEKTLSTLESSVQRGAQLVRQLLTFGRGAEGEKGRLPLAPIIQEMLTIAQQTFPKNITIETEITEDVAPVLGDATQVHQVLLNLCVNARDAMPQGGTLTIAAGNVQIDAKSAAATPGAKAGDYVCLSVTDTGTGMTPEIVDKIFDPFFTTKEVGKGTGLGLATVLGLVKSHGGFVSLSSELGKGSTFRVHFPVAPKSETAVPFARTMAPPPGHGELLLVVDDEENIRDTVRGMLIQHGYTVMVAEDGIEGISRCAEALNEIKLVVTDLDMPNMDGLTMIRILRQMNSKLKIVVSSGITSRKQIAGSRASELTALGVTAFLDKPYTGDQILRTIHDALAS